MTFKLLIYREPDVDLVKCQCCWENFSFSMEKFKIYQKNPDAQWFLILNILLQLGKLKQI